MLTHRVDPKCRMCSIKTRLLPAQDGGRQAPDQAVWCRWYPKGHPKNDSMRPGKRRRRLTCWTCADKRARQFEDEKPLEELWAASGRIGGVYYVPGPSA
jgi:hypothetical protein